MGLHRSNRAGGHGRARGVFSRQRPDWPVPGLVSRRPIGLAKRTIYWFSWGLTYALGLSIAVSVCSFWNAAWVQAHQTVFFFGLWLAFPAFNLIPVDVCGQIEYGITLGKVMANLGSVLLMAGPTKYCSFLWSVAAGSCMTPWRLRASGVFGGAGKWWGKVRWNWGVRDYCSERFIGVGVGQTLQLGRGLLF